MKLCVTHACPISAWGCPQCAHAEGQRLQSQAAQLRRMMGMAEPAAPVEPIGPEVAELREMWTSRGRLIDTLVLFPENVADLPEPDGGRIVPDPQLHRDHVLHGGHVRLAQHAYDTLTRLQRSDGRDREPFLYQMWDRLIEGCTDQAVRVDDPKKADYHGPADVAHQSVHQTSEHLLNGRVTDTAARRALRDALDKADALVKPKPGLSSKALGQHAQPIGMRLP